MPSEEVNYVQRVDRMLNRWAGVRSNAQPKERTRVEVGKESSGNGDSFEVSSNATVVMGETSCIGFRAYQMIAGTKRENRMRKMHP